MKPDTCAIDTLLKGSRSLGTSARSIWTSIEVERRHADPIERPQDEFNDHYVILWGNKPTISEREYKVGKFRRVVKPPHSLSLGCAGRLPAVRAITPYDVIACVIKSRAAEAMNDEVGARSSLTLYDHLGVVDDPLTQLIGLAALEADSGCVNGRLYRESIEQAILIRFLTLARSEAVAGSRLSPLPNVALKRVIERMQIEYARDLSLEDLAAEVGYSRSHFLKMFHLATGTTPFAYLRDIRLEAAHRELLVSNDNIASIAAQTGFSSHSHLTRLFARRYGVSPRDFRRNR